MLLLPLRTRKSNSDKVKFSLHYRLKEWEKATPFAVAIVGRAITMEKPIEKINHVRNQYKIKLKGKEQKK